MPLPCCNKSVYKQGSALYYEKETYEKWKDFLATKKCKNFGIQLERKRGISCREGIIH
jgi:hypothetical protein